MMRKFLFRSCWLISLSIPLTGLANGLRERVLIEAGNILEMADISYAYGGSSLGTEADCAACTRCLEIQQPQPGVRFIACPTCKSCSLDCSHFVHMAYQRSGIKMGYLPTAEMLQLSARQLLQRYGLIDFGLDVAATQPGDLLVYRGHVVMVEAVKGGGYGDIIHATGGRDIRGPGLGIQRERRVPMSSFRGPLLRILRPKALVQGWRPPTPSLRKNSQLPVRTGPPDAG